MQFSFKASRCEASNMAIRWCGGLMAARCLHHGPFAASRPHWSRNRRVMPVIPWLCCRRCFSFVQLRGIAAFSFQFHTFLPIESSNGAYAIGISALPFCWLYGTESPHDDALELRRSKYRRHFIEFSGDCQGDFPACFYLIWRLSCQHILGNVWVFSRTMQNRLIGMKSSATPARGLTF